MRWCSSLPPPWILEAVTTAVLGSAARAFPFDGPWHAWRRRRRRAPRPRRRPWNARATTAEPRALRRRFRYKKSKAKQAQAKLTEIARLEKQRRAAADELTSLTKKRRTLGFEFLKPPWSGRIVLEGEAHGRRR